MIKWLGKCSIRLTHKLYNLIHFCSWNASLVQNTKKSRRFDTSTFYPFIFIYLLIFVSILTNLHLKATFLGHFWCISMHINQRENISRDFCTSKIPPKNVFHHLPCLQYSKYMFNFWSWIDSILKLSSNANNMIPKLQITNTILLHK